MSPTLDVPALVRTLCRYPSETEWFEFKTNNEEPKTIGKNISALANSAALAEKLFGYVVWGVHDASHDIVGTKFSPLAKKVKQEALDHWLSRQLKPDVDFRFFTDRIDSYTVVVLRIPAAESVPVRFNREAFVRVGSHTRKLIDFPAKEQRFWREVGSRRFEREVAVEQVKADDVLKMLDYGAYFELMEIPPPASSTGILEALEQEQMIRRRDDESWDVMNLGFITFANSLADSFRLRRKSLRIVRYKANNRLAAEEEVEITAGYATGFGKALRELSRLTPRKEQLRGGIRRNVPSIPPLAVREVIANMLIHQDFTETGNGPMVEVFDDRLEASNPGKSLVDKDRIVDHRPQSRNEAIASLLRQLGICEERGSGWEKIVGSIEAMQLPAPRIEVVGNNTRVTLFAARPLADLNSDERSLAVYLHACLQHVSSRAVTNATVRKRFGIRKQNSAKASRFLREAMDAGLIKALNPDSGKKSRRYGPFWAA